MNSTFFNRHTLGVLVLTAIALLVSFAHGQAMGPDDLLITAMVPTISFGADEQRAVFARLDKWFQANNMGRAHNFIITESSLRVEQVLASNQNQYGFDLYEGSSTVDRPLEIKLNRNDLYFATHIALGLAKYDPSTSPKRYGNYPIFTHPDTNYFNGTGGSALAEYQALETVYEGRLTFTTGSVTRFGPMASSNLKYIPNRALLEGVAASTNTSLVYPEFGPSLEGRGFRRLTPNLVIDGQETNIFTLSLGAGDITNIAGETNEAGASVDTRNVVILQVYGFRAIGAGKAAKEAGASQASF